MNGARIISLTVAALILALDQWTKSLVRAAWPEGAGKAMIPGFFNLVHAENPGAAFSMLADASPAVRGIVLIGIACVVTLFLVAALFGKFGIVTSAVSRWAVTLILSGAVGNLIDRIRVGTVTDFLEFYVGIYYWPAFNVADSAIFCGAVLLIIDYWMQSRKNQANAVEPESVS